MRGANRARQTALRAAAYPIALVALMVFVVGCSSGQGSARLVGTPVQVNESDFRISVSPVRVPAGDVVLTIRNHGPASHELIVVKARALPMPFRTDGLTVDEERLERATVGIAEPGAPGSVRHLRIHMRPGLYKFFCNMSGHYLGGMHTEVVAS